MDKDVIRAVTVNIDQELVNVVNLLKEVEKYIDLDKFRDNEWAKLLGSVGDIQKENDIIKEELKK